MKVNSNPLRHNNNNNTDSSLVAPLNNTIGTRTTQHTTNSDNNNYEEFVAASEALNRQNNHCLLQQIAAQQKYLANNQRKIKVETRDASKLNKTVQIIIEEVAIQLHKCFKHLTFEISKEVQRTCLEKATTTKANNVLFEENLKDLPGKVIMASHKLLKDCVTQQKLGEYIQQTVNKKLNKLKNKLTNSNTTIESIAKNIWKAQKRL